MKNRKIMALMLAGIMVLAAGCSTDKEGNPKDPKPGKGEPGVEETVSGNKFLVSYAYNDYHYSEILTMMDEIYKAPEAKLETLDYGILDKDGKLQSAAFVKDTKEHYEKQEMFPVFEYLHEKNWIVVKMEDYEVHDFEEIVEAIFNVEFREEFVASYPDRNIVERHDTRSFIEDNQKHYENKDFDKILDYVEEKGISFVGIRYVESENPAPEVTDEETEGSEETPSGESDETETGEGEAENGAEVENPDEETLEEEKSEETEEEQTNP